MSLIGVPRTTVCIASFLSESRNLKSSGHLPGAVHPHFSFLQTNSLVVSPSSSDRRKNNSIVRIASPFRPQSIRFHVSAMANAADEGNTSAGEKKKIGVLFVCLGNICRSPSAEGVFTHLVQQRGLSDMFDIDSAGTIDYHAGDPADPRMRKAAANRGIDLMSISRRIRPEDFERFDHILAMDQSNLGDITEAYLRWATPNKLPKDGLSKVKLMCSYCRTSKYSEVPDPYYGGPQGFETVLDILDDACNGLLEDIVTKNQ